MIHRRCFGLVVLGLVLLGRGEAAASDDSPEATEAARAWPLEDFLILPLRAHVLSATELPEVDCRLRDEDVARIIRKVNVIWHQAGAHWGLEPVIREPAARQDEFRASLERDGARRLTLFRMLVPEANRRTEGLHVYYLHDLPVNGVWMGDDFALVRETARLRPVPGGIDEPIPRVTAHELGHALGLPHRQDLTNLLASGTTGTSLNAEEVETARRKARAVRGVLTVSALENEAGATRDKARARRLWTWLSELPGGEPKARRRLDALPE